METETETETAAPAPVRPPGQILRDIRKVLAPEGEKVLTQARLAKQLGYAEEYVQSMETGRRPMQPHHVGELANLRVKLKLTPERAGELEGLLAELGAAVARYGAQEAASEEETAEAVLLRVAGQVTALAGMAERTERMLGGGLDMQDPEPGTVQGKLTEALSVLHTVGARQERDGAELSAVRADLTRVGPVLEVLRAKQEEGAEAVQAELTRTRAELSTLQTRQDEGLEASEAIQAKQDQAAATLSAVKSTLSQSASTLDAIKTRQEEASAKQDTTHDKVDRLHRTLWGVGAFIAAGFLLFAFVLFRQGGLANLAQAPGSTHVVDLNVRVTPGPHDADELRHGPGSKSRDVQHVDVDLGKAPKESWVPNAPIRPEQQRPPCSGVEEEINGACYIRVHLKPPCGEYLRHGDNCYITVVESPKKPMSDPTPRVNPR